VIGYVGKTGLASGPHLHYEFLVNGKQRNPLKLALPPGPPITPELHGTFETKAQPLLARLDLLRDTDLALLD
jgi:murein DD-endopeptidase MepM/ murein hydrolase activator NlpD